MSDTTLIIRADAPIGVISPRLYGHFAEHLGRCCYDGLWVGAGRGDIPQQNGFRSDVLAALRALPTPLLRWPGGCYADHYHWRDGIGPAAERPIRLGMSCGLQVEDDNSLGAHEFLWLCAQIGAEPYLAGNVGSGTPQELCDWLEYCNTAVPTTLGRLRAANGAPQPFGVKLWGVGNENWGCGGNYTAAAYAREYVRYATMLRHVDPRAELVVCGQDDDWNVELLQTIGKHQNLIDHLSIHRYWINGGAETEFGAAEYYALLAEADDTEQFVKRTTAILQEATGGKRPIGIALDEWGVWHPEARDWGPGDVTRREPTTYEQAGTLRDALAAAVGLEGFHRQCQVLTLANLAQIVNVLHAPVMTDGARMWLTPTYHALRLHAPHIGATALPVEIEHGNGLPDGSSAVSATASHTENGLALTLINRHFDQGAGVQVLCADAPEQATGQMLTADSPRASNSAEQPDRVAPVRLPITADGRGAWRVEMPPHTLATMLFRP
jgi:alpha-N-arabinofuranosidase